MITEMSLWCSRLSNALQLNSSLLSRQSRCPSQRLHSDLHSPEPQRNSVSASQAEYTRINKMQPKIDTEFVQFSSVQFSLLIPCRN